jgi:hypothetical protein
MTSLRGAVLGDLRIDLHGAKMLGIGWQADAWEVFAKDRSQSISDVPAERGCHGFGRFVWYPVT